MSTACCATKINNKEKTVSDASRPAQFFCYRLAAAAVASATALAAAIIVAACQYENEDDYPAAVAAKETVIAHY